MRIDADRQYRFRLFEATGRGITTEGSEDERINLEGLSGGRTPLWAERAALVRRATVMVTCSGVARRVKEMVTRMGVVRRARVVVTPTDVSEEGGSSTEESCGDNILRYAGMVLWLYKEVGYFLFSRKVNTV